MGRDYVEDRIMPVVDGCWLWTGASTGGRGQIKQRRHPRYNDYAYRVVYEQYMGPIPDGMVLDHLCGQPLCVNPQHLEPVTIATNVRRAFGVNGETCRNGHRWADDNDYRKPTGARRCRTCHRQAEQTRKGEQ